MGASSYERSDAAKSNTVEEIKPAQREGVKKNVNRYGGFQFAFPHYQLNRQKTPPAKPNETNSKPNKTNANRTITYNKSINFDCWQRKLCRD